MILQKQTGSHVDHLRSHRTTLKQKGLLCNALTLNIEFLVHYSSSMLQALPYRLSYYKFRHFVLMLAHMSKVILHFMRPFTALKTIVNPVCTVITSKTLFVSYPLSAHDIAFELRGHHSKALQIYFLQ